MITSVTISAGENNEFPQEGLCWEVEQDPVTGGSCVLFGVPTWSVEFTT